MIGVYATFFLPEDVYLPICEDTKKAAPKGCFRKTGSVLLSRAVTRQVSSALKSLTTVFGMGTGVTSPLLPPDIRFVEVYPQIRTTYKLSLCFTSSKPCDCHL